MASASGRGHDLVQVVQRTWTRLLAQTAGQPIDPGARIPVRWREYAAQRIGLQALDQMTDGASTEFEPFESG